MVFHLQGTYLYYSVKKQVLKIGNTCCSIQKCLYYTKQTRSSLSIIITMKKPRHQMLPINAVWLMQLQYQVDSYRLGQKQVYSIQYVITVLLYTYFRPTLYFYTDLCIACELFRDFNAYKLPRTQQGPKVSGLTSFLR